MVQMRKDGIAVRVPLKAYKDTFEGQGWELATAPSPEPEGLYRPEAETNPQALVQTETMVEVEAEAEAEVEDEVEMEEVRKPLGEMSMEELVDFANEQGIDTDGKTRKEIRNAIRALSK